LPKTSSRLSSCLPLTTRNFSSVMQIMLFGMLIPMCSATRWESRKFPPCVLPTEGVVCKLNTALTKTDEVEVHLSVTNIEVEVSPVLGNAECPYFYILNLTVKDIPAVKGVRPAEKEKAASFCQQIKYKKTNRVELTFDSEIELPEFILSEYPSGRRPTTKKFKREGSLPITNVVLGDPEKVKAKARKFSVEMEKKHSNVLQIKFTANVTKYIESLRATNETNKAKAQTAKDDAIKAKEIQTAKRNDA